MEKFELSKILFRNKWRFKSSVKHGNPYQIVLLGFAIYHSNRNNFELIVGFFGLEIAFWFHKPSN